MIQVVLTLIRATRKTSLNCMSSPSVCLVPNVHCKRSQQLRTICTCVTVYTHKFDTQCRCKELPEQNGFSVSHPLVLYLRNAFDITINQTIKRYYRLQQLGLPFVLQMEWCIIHHIRAQYIETKIVSEYDQEISQSQTADNPVASRGRAAQPSRDTRKTN